jgi:hypothetical protein
MLPCKCGNSIPQKRRELGYKVCVSCSTESKWSGVQVVHHKTGNEIQVVKDPEVAAEFIAKSSRAGFGALRGMVGSYKKPLNPPAEKRKKVLPVSPTIFNVIIGAKEMVTNYQDDTIGPMILDKLEYEGKEVAVKNLEKEFQAMKISPGCRKRLLYIINNS